MSHKRLTSKTTYRYRSEFGLADESCVIYHATTKEPLFSCHASVIPLIKAAGKLAPYAELLKILKAGAA